MHFGKRFSQSELDNLLLVSKKYDGNDYLNSIVYKHPELNWSIKKVECTEREPKDIKDICNSFAWTELYFVNLLSCEPNFLNYIGYCLCNNFLYIITEWIPNSITLNMYLENNPDFHDTFFILLQLFVCLEILYKKH